MEDFDGKRQQRGSGAYTLCWRCNSETGRCYGNAFVDWVRQGMAILHWAAGSPTLYYNFHIFPLRVLKQILCMFFSTGPSGFGAKNQELVRFVLDPNRRFVPSRFRVYVHYTVSARRRLSGIVGQLVLNPYAQKSRRIFSEISWPPFGYVLCFESDPPNENLLDITDWGKAEYNYWGMVPLKMPVLPVYTYFPGDYRDKDQVERETKANIEAAAKSMSARPPNT